MTFDPNDPRITAYIFGEMSDNERIEFDAEMDISAQLRQVVEETQETLKTLEGELHSETSLSLTGEQRRAIEQQIDQTPVHVAHKDGSQREQRWTSLVTVAASILVACGLSAAGYVLSKSEPRQIAQQQPVVARVEPETVKHRLMERREAESSAVESKAKAIVTLSKLSPTVSSPVSGKTEEIQGTKITLQNGQTATEFGITDTRGISRNLAVTKEELSKSLKQVQGQLEEESLRVTMGAKLPAQQTPDGLLAGVAGKRKDGVDQIQLRSVPARYAIKEIERLSRLQTEKTSGVVLGPKSEAKATEDLSFESRQYGWEDRDNDQGLGPGMGGDQYEPITDNSFMDVMNAPLSTFSIDVDTAAYSKVRMYLMQNSVLPRPDAVRIEELMNYFTYDYQPPTDDKPFTSHVEVADCPWNGDHRLVRVGIKGREIDRDKRPASNLVFLLDVSGSMDRANKLPLLKRGMKMLTDQLNENDRVAIVVYAGAAGLVLDSTTGDQKQVILDSLDRLKAGGSTNGGQGIRLAYQKALDNFITGGANRVILCTDGDFNIGTTGTDELVRMAEENAKTGVFLSVLGFGMGNHNDAMLEQISNKGNGNYGFIDTDAEARKVLVEQMSGTLVTIAKDVKIQIEFNPNEVAAYRLIGYENRILAAEDFNDDTKDAGEIGAGHTVTALYEVVPADVEDSVEIPPVDDLRYQRVAKRTKEADNGELLTLKIRYKQPDGDVSTKLEFPVKDGGQKFGQATKDFRFAAAVASFGMVLRNSPYKGNATMAGVAEIAQEAATGDTSGYREEFVKMVERAKQIRGE